MLKEGQGDDMVCYPGDVGIGPISPPQEIAGQRPMGPVTDYEHGCDGTRNLSLSELPPQYRKKADMGGDDADL